MGKLTFELVAEAEAEFYDIIAYYKDFDTTLSRNFIHEFETAVRHLINFPKSGQPYLYQTRRIFLDRFPYTIIYKIYRNELIVVYAIMHKRRKPGYWENRLE